MKARPGFRINALTPTYTLGLGPARIVGAPGGIRTPDPLIRSQMLYPLSYGRAIFRRFHAHLDHLIRLAGPFLKSGQSM
jgi:hypothetical protein